MQSDCEREKAGVKPTGYITVFDLRAFMSAVLAALGNAIMRRRSPDVCTLQNLCSPFPQNQMVAQYAESLFAKSTARL